MVGHFVSSRDLLPIDALFGHDHLELAEIGVWIDYFWCTRVLRLWLFFFLDTLLNIDYLDAEEKYTVRGDGVSHSFVAIGIVRWANQFCFGSFREAKETFIPALDNLLVAYFEFHRSATVIARIERRAIDKSALVVCMHLVAFL